MKQFVVLSFLILSLVGQVLGQVLVDDLGALGNGLQDDSEMIQAAIDLAGVGGRIEFTPGKIYRSCKVVEPMQDQVLDFRGAIMKRCDEIVTDVLSFEGTNDWVVADPSGFEVGMWLTASTNGGYDQTTGIMPVYVIDGNVLTLGTPVEPPLPNAVLSTDTPLLFVRESGVTIENFVFDGNYPNNGSIIKWDTSNLLKIGGANTLIQNGKVFSIPGDFISFASESDGSIVQNVEVSDGAGVFAHLTGIGFEGPGGITIKNNVIYDLGKEYIREDHAFGAIEWSDDVGSVYITGNCFDNLPYPAINARDDSRSEELDIRGNFASRTEGFVNLFKLEVDSDLPGRQSVKIINNRLWDTKGNRIQVGSPLEPFTELEITFNRSQNTYWDIKGVEDLDFKNNITRITDLDAAGLSSTFDWFFAPGTLNLRSIGSAEVDNNQFLGNWRQISFENSGEANGYGFVDEYSFTNNKFKDFLYSGLQGRASQNGVGSLNEIVNWSSSNNAFESSVLGNGTGTGTAGIGVIFSAGGTHTDNCIDIDSPMSTTFAAQMYGYDTATSPGDAGAFTNNTFVNENGRAAIWGSSPQLSSLSTVASTLSDNISLSNVTANMGTESASVIDTDAMCPALFISNISQGPFCSITPVEAFDFGDLPQCYGTIRSSNGPHHNRLNDGPVLGSLVDFEDDANPSATADGDNLDNSDDQDGISQFILNAGEENCLDIESVSGGVLDAWIDFGNDCSLFQGVDRVANGVTLPEGGGEICFDVPASVPDGNVYGRFRITESGINSPLGPAPDGEVEDYQFVVAAPLVLDAKVFLSGPYSTGSMTSDMTAFIPLEQPYNDAPWNYDGDESITTAASDMVDWVLLELRESPEASSLVYRKAALLLEDGSIVDSDGSGPVKFTNLEMNDFHVVVRHRNHLPVMSSALLSLSGVATSFDFTLASSTSVGVNPIRDMGDGNFALWAGDGNKDLIITAFDFLQVWLPQNGSSPGYSLGDFDLSGSVTAFDFLEGWLPSNGQSSQVEE